MDGELHVSGSRSSRLAARAASSHQYHEASGACRTTVHAENRTSCRPAPAHPGFAVTVRRLRQRELVEPDVVDPEVECARTDGLELDGAEERGVERRRARRQLREGEIDQDPHVGRDEEVAADRAHAHRSRAGPVVLRRHGRGRVEQDPDVVLPLHPEFDPGAAAGVERRPRRVDDRSVDQKPIPAYDVSAPLMCIARMLLSLRRGVNPTGFEGTSDTGGVIDENPEESMYVYQ